MELSAAIWAAPEGGYVARVLEIPSVMTQGETLYEVRVNLADALQPTMDAGRAQTEALLAGTDFIRERITIEVPDPEPGY